MFELRLKFTLLRIFSKQANTLTLKRNDFPPEENDTVTMTTTTLDADEDDDDKCQEIMWGGPSRKLNGQQGIYFQACWCCPLKFLTLPLVSLYMSNQLHSLTMTHLSAKIYLSNYLLFTKQYKCRRGTSSSYFVARETELM